MTMALITFFVARNGANVGGGQGITPGHVLAYTSMSAHPIKMVASLTALAGKADDGRGCQVRFLPEQSPRDP